MFPVACFFFPYCPLQSQILCSKYPSNICTQLGFSSLRTHSIATCWPLIRHWSIWWLKSLSSPVLWETLHVTPLHKLRGDKYGMTFNSYLVLWFSFPLSLHHTTIQVTGESFFLTPKFVTNYSSWRTHAPPDIVDLLGSYFRLSQILVIFMQAQTIMPLFLFASLDPWPRALLILIPKTPLNTHV